MHDASPCDIFSSMKPFRLKILPLVDDGMQWRLGLLELRRFVRSFSYFTRIDLFVFSQ
jgi:hypothetical protein